jgi:DNA-binding transcriptional LysR family regulator
MAVFERFSGGVRPTHSGQTFLRQAQSILRQLDALVAISHSIGHGETGRLAIGFYPSLSAGNFRASLVELRHRFPQIEIEMIESSRSALVAALRSSTVDIAIVTGSAALPGCNAASLWTERIVFALPENHPLGGKDVVYWTDLKDQNVVLSRRDPGPELRDLIIAKLASPEDRPKISFHDVSRGSLWNLIGAGFGISLLTEANAGANFLGVIYKEIRDNTEPARIAYSAHWRPDNKNPALRSFLNLLAERYPLPACTTV